MSLNCFVNMFFSRSLSIYILRAKFEHGPTTSYAAGLLRLGDTFHPLWSVLSGRRQIRRRSPPPGFVAPRAEPVPPGGVSPPHNPNLHLGCTRHTTPARSRTRNEHWVYGLKTPPHQRCTSSSHGACLMRRAGVGKMVAQYANEGRGYEGVGNPRTPVPRVAII